MTGMAPVPDFCLSFLALGAPLLIVGALLCGGWWSWCRLAGRTFTRPRHWARELSFVAGFYGLYSVFRDQLPAGRVGPAVAHGAAVAHLELGAAIERHLSAWLIARPVADHWALFYYGAAHLFGTLAVLAWLYLRRPELFSRLRWVLGVVSVVALPIFALYPVAPPRSVPSLHVLGLVPVGDSALGLQYAALPSLHVAWAVWCAWALWLGLRGRWRWVGPAYAGLTCLVVFATGNHFVIDAVGGAALDLAVRVGFDRARQFIEARRFAVEAAEWRAMFLADVDAGVQLVDREEVYA